MRNLPIDMLRSFVMINELGGFTAAADKLGRSQPAISQHVKKLENILSRRLLERNGSSILLTPEGDSLLSYARQILSINDEAVGHFARPSVSGRIRFGIPSEFAITLLPRIVSRFAKAYSDVTLEVTCDLSRNLSSDEQRNQYDLILLLHDQLDDLKKEKVDHFIKIDELVWVSGGSHVHLQETLPLVAAPSGCIYRQRALRKLGEAKRSCRIVYTIPDLTGIQAAIDEGLGVTVLARSTVPAGLSVIDSSDQLPELGRVGISLKKMAINNNNAVDVLADFITMELE